MRTLKQINQSISSCHSLCRVISCSKYSSILLRSFASTAPIAAQGQSNTVIKYKNNVANPWGCAPAFTMVEQRPCLASSSALANLEYRLETRTREKVTRLNDSQETLTCLDSWLLCPKTPSNACDCVLPTTPRITPKPWVHPWWADQMVPRLCLDRKRTLLRHQHLDAMSEPRG